MEVATFRNWLAEQGCRFDRQLRRQRHKGQVRVTVHRDGRKAVLASAGSRELSDPRLVRRVREELELDWFQLPGPRSGV
jgi:hypothetical protein